MINHHPNLSINFFRIRSRDTLSNALTKSEYITSTYDLLLGVGVTVRSYVNGTMFVWYSFEVGPLGGSAKSG